MKRSLLTVVGSTALLVLVSPSAKADAFLSLQNGATLRSCDNSTAAGVAACFAGGFTTALGANVISFSGAVGGYSVLDVTLTSNSPGTASQAFVMDTKTQVQNISAGATALIVSFAQNNFVLPAGSPLVLSASQSATFTAAAVGSSQSFAAWANASNSLATSTGVAVITPSCINPASAPPANACSTVGVPVLFNRAGAFAVNGVETIALSQGGIASLGGAISLTPTTITTVTPEPGSFVLFATGLFGFVGGRRVFRRKAA